VPTVPQKTSQLSTLTSSQIKFQYYIYSSLYLVNDLIHEEIDRQSSTRRNDATSFDIDGELEKSTGEKASCIQKR